MSNICDLNQKNVKLKNISTNCSVHHTKINISNLIAETQRIISSSIKKKINNQQILNTNINSPKLEITSKETQNSNDFYRSYSSNRPHSKQSILNKRNNISNNLNTEKSQIINDNYLNTTNINQKKKTNLSPSEMLTKFAHFAQNLNKNQNKTKNKNKNIHYTNLGVKSIHHKRNPQSNFELRNIKKPAITTNNSLSNINNISTNENRNNISYINQTQYQNYSNISEINKNNKEKKNLGKNSSNDRFDLMNKHNTPLSPSCTYNYNNMNNLLNEVFKSTANKSKNEIKRNIRNNIQTQSHISENSQGIMTTQSTKNKNSFNSTKTEGENKINTIINKNTNNNNNNNNNNTNNNIYNQNNIHNLIIMNINSPEELHFFYVNILQNGKVLEGKFEITNSINP